MILLAKLFPHTGRPDRLAHRLRRLDAKESNAHGHLVGSVTVELKYPGLDGRDETAQARIYLPQLLRDEASRRVPLPNAIHPADRNFKVTEWNEAMEMQLPMRGREYRILRPDGAIVWVEGYAVPLLNDQAEILGPLHPSRRRHQDRGKHDDKPPYSRPHILALLASSIQEFGLTRKGFAA